MTPAENTRRGYPARKTHCKWGHDLTDPANLYPRKNGGRECLTCKREQMASRPARHKDICKRGHDLTDPANLKPTKSGRRQCRACSNLARMDRYRRLGK